MLVCYVNNPIYILHWAHPALHEVVDALSFHTKGHPSAKKIFVIIIIIRMDMGQSVSM